jgi:hypothetical protein
MGEEIDLGDLVNLRVGQGEPVLTEVIQRFVLEPLFEPSRRFGSDPMPKTVPGFSTEDRMPKELACVVLEGRVEYRGIESGEKGRAFSAVNCPPEDLAGNIVLPGASAGAAGLTIPFLERDRTSALGAPEREKPQIRRCLWEGLAALQAEGSRSQRSRCVDLACGSISVDRSVAEDADGEFWLALRLDRLVRHGVVPWLAGPDRADGRGQGKPDAPARSFGR